MKSNKSFFRHFHRKPRRCRKSLMKVSQLNCTKKRDLLILAAPLEKAYFSISPRLTRHPTYLQYSMYFQKKKWKSTKSQRLLFNRFMILGSFFRRIFYTTSSYGDYFSRCFSWIGWNFANAFLIKSNVIEINIKFLKTQSITFNVNIHGSCFYITQ